MKSVLKQLADNESILLMYLADELPPRDRQAVEQRLASDGELRRQLEALSELQEFCQKSIRALDAQSPADLTESATLRRAGRLLQQWALLQRRPEETGPLTTRPIPWLRYGLSAAAVMGLAYLVWWGNQPASAPQLTDVVPPPNPPAQFDDTLSPDVKLSMLLDTMNASAADDSVDRQVAAADARGDDINFSVDVPKQDDSQ
jgi:anti-sigma factor RsiW